MDEPHNVQSPVSIFARAVFSELRDLQLYLVAGRNFMFDEGTVIESWDVHDSCQRNVLVDDTQDITHAGQNDHDVDFHDKTDNGSKETDEKWWVRISEVFKVVDGILHHQDSSSDILLYVDVHEHGGDKSRNHHVKSLDWSDGESFVGLGVLPNTHDHDDLNELDDDCVHEHIRSL